MVRVGQEELVERVAGSGAFAKSPRLREFLAYVAECTLEDRPLDAREQVIAERVFGRAASFQSGQDSIVRAEARNLRKRLEVYFADEGRSEPLILTMPKGGYLLAFERRPALLEEVSIALPVTEPLPPSPDDPPAHRRVRWWIAAIICLLACLLALQVFLAQRRSARGTLPFSALLSTEDDTLIVTSDTGLLQISSVAHRRITLDEYMARSYPSVTNIEPPDLIRNWNLYEFTDGREMAIAGLIIRNHAQFAARIFLRSGHEVQLQEFKDHNAILVGSPISNPWAQLYEDQLNFQCELTESGRIVFRNTKPTRGELQRYPGADDIKHGYTYARIVFVPKAAGEGAALLIAGTTAQSTQAAGEFVVDSGRMERLLRGIGIDPQGVPRRFEVLLRSSNFVGGAILPEVVAWRR